jgi:hypothetical protein
MKKADISTQLSFQSSYELWDSVLDVSEYDLLIAPLKILEFVLLEPPQLRERVRTM